MNTDIQAIVDIAQTLGFSAIFLWLLLRSESRYQAVIDAAQHRYDVLMEKYMEDMRTIAGLRQNLHRVQTYVADAKQVQSNSEMASL